MRGPAEPPIRRRPTDRLESLVFWLLAVVALGGIGVAAVVGPAEYGSATDRVRAEVATRAHVTAVLTEDAPDAPPIGAYRRPATFAETSWTAPDGSTRTGRVEVAIGARAGTTTGIWIAADGGLSAEPASTGSAVEIAVIAAAFVLFLTTSFVAGVWWVVHRATFAINIRAWEQEWERIEPMWRRNRDQRHADEE